METTMLQIFSNFYQHALKNQFSLLLQCKTHPILMNHYHWNRLFYIQILKHLSFLINRDPFVMVLSNL